MYYMQQVKPGASLYVLGTDLLKETIIKGGFKLTTLLEEKRILWLSVLICRLIMKSWP